eukprot:384271_1
MATDLFSVNNNKDVSLLDNDKNNNGPQQKKMRLDLHKNDTLLHHIMSKESANKIVQFAVNKIVICIFMTLNISVFVSDVVSLFIEGNVWFLTSNHWVMFLSIILFQIPMSGYSILLLLSSNCKSCKLLIRSFEFCFKIFYGVQYLFLSLVLITINSGFSSTLEAVSWFFNSGTTLLVVITISAMDGIYLPIVTKRIIISTFTAIFTVFTIYFSIFGMEIYTKNSINIYQHEIPLASIAFSTYKTLVIFFIKQTVSSMIYKEKATVIKQSLYITWSD